jgi:hypothetical protein
MNLRYVGIFFMLYSGNACIADLQNDLNQLKERLVQLNTALDALTPKKLTREEEIQSLNKYFTKFFAHAKQQGNYKDVNNSDFLSFVQKVTRYYRLLGGPDIDEKDVPSWETEFESRGSKDAGFKSALRKATLDELSKWINEGNDFSQFALNDDLDFIITIKEYRTLNGKADAYQNVREALIKAIKPEELKNRLDSYKESWENSILRDLLYDKALLGIKIYREITKDPTAFQEFETEINEWVKQEASKQ